MSETPDVKTAKREVSTIVFPYLDLDDAIAVARMMLERGGVAMDRDQMAAALGQVPTSGAFNNKVSTARLFGLIENNQGRYALTPLGFNILDPGRERAAKAEAFLNVPLYRRTYDEFKGRQLPPRPVGLEQAFANFGVSAKQTDKARQAFDRSARSAGYFPSAAEDRLVAPVLGPAPPPLNAPPMIPSARTALRPSRAALRIRPLLRRRAPLTPSSKGCWTRSRRRAPPGLWRTRPLGCRRRHTSSASCTRARARSS